MDKPIIVIKDEDIFPNEDLVSNFPVGWERKAVKAIVFDENMNIALLGSRCYLLPGGGVEGDETLKQALAREIWEEMGCWIKDIEEIGYGLQIRNKLGNQRVHFFTCSLDGAKGTPQTKQKDEKNVRITWLPLTNAIELLEKEVSEIPFEEYHACFNVRTHLAFLKKYMQRGI